MSKIKKRPYSSVTRSSQAIETKNRILASAKNLFETVGFECVTIEKNCGSGSCFNTNDLFPFSIKARYSSSLNG